MRLKVCAAIAAIVTVGGCDRRAKTVDDPVAPEAASATTDDAVSAGDGDDDVRPEPPVPLLACEAACANLGRIMVAEVASLGEGAAEMRESIETSSGAACITACHERGDAESVACIVKASTLLELGACEGPQP